MLSMLYIAGALESEHGSDQGHEDRHEGRAAGAAAHH
jgi:hypothetical protein